MEEKLVLEYIGKNADEIVNEKLNWPAAIMSIFFGPAWFFYRKSYLLGFACMYFMGSGIFYWIGRSIGMHGIIEIVVRFFVYLFLANTLYLWDVRRKVRKIMVSSADMPEEQLISAVRKKGGTSTVALAIYITINVICKIYIFFKIKEILNAILKFDFKKFLDELRHFPRIG